MLEQSARLVLEAQNFKNIAWGLCRISGERWRPGALGYVLVQVRERLAKVEEVDVLSVLELCHLLNVAREVHTQHPDPRKVREIVRLVAESVKVGSAQYLKQEGRYDQDERHLLGETGSEINLILRWLQEHEKGA